MKSHIDLVLILLPDDDWSLQSNYYINHLSVILLNNYQKVA